jgi:ribosome-binding factor A
VAAGNVKEDGMTTGRVRRVADRIRVIVAEMLERRIKDARLGFVTITDVRVTGDNQHASIFYTVLGDDAQRTASGAALESAKGLIRSEVGKQLGMRHTPTLEFILDAVPETAAHIEELLAQVRSSDAAVAAAASEASYAGDPDPYKHPDPDDADPAAAGS